MFGWALTFLVIALVAAVFGFGGIAAVSIDFAQIRNTSASVSPSLRITFGEG